MTRSEILPLNVLSFGAGALGTYVAGSLALQGHHVVFLERLEVAEQLRSQGLRLTINGQLHILQEVSIVGSMAEAIALGPFNIAIFALKSYDTANALASLLPYSENLPPVLCLQNGVTNEKMLSDALGSYKVIAGTVTSAVGRRDAGDITLERLRGLGVAAGHPFSIQLVAALDQAGLNARLYENHADMKWSKLLTNLVGNATSAILNMSPAEIYAHPGLYSLEVAQLRECLAVMKSQKIRAVNLPGTPVKLLAFGIIYLPHFISRMFLGHSVGKGRGAKMPSFHIDLHSGRGQSEVSYLNGGIVEAGNQLGIPTPANKTLTDTLLGLTFGKLKISDFDHQPERLLAILQEVGHAG